MGLGLALAMAALAPTAAEAQTPYSVTHSTDTYVSFTGGTSHVPIAYGAFPNWDEGAAAISLPFPFTWYGQTYRTVYVYTNGFVSFSASPTGAGLLTPPTTVPSPSHPIHNYIGVLWGDLVGGTNPSIRSQVTGSAGSRIVGIQVEGMLASNNANSEATFQVYLHEGTNRVDVLYGRNFGLSSLTAGIENSNGTDGQNLMASSPTCGVTCACNPRACNSPSFLPGKLISIELPADVELNAGVSAPNGAYPGTSFPVRVVLRNVGLTAAGGFQYELRLSPSNTSTAGSTLLRAVNVTGIPPSTSVTSTETVTLAPSTPVGTFYVAAVVDSTQAVSEAVETNNIAYSGRFVTGPDLVGGLSSPAETGPLETLPVQFGLQSAGAPVTDPVPVTFYLSTTPSVGAGAVSLGTRLITLPNGFATSNQLDFLVPAMTPLSPPPYYVVAEIDQANGVVETDETNNTVVSPSTLEVQGPDLQVTSFAGDRFGFRGRAYSTTVVLRNEGAATARDFDVCVVLSDNLVISVTTDRIIERTPTLTVGPRADATLRLEPVIPADVANGTWYVAAVADCAGVVTESVETNNIARRSGPITVRDVAPDFVPVEVVTASAAAAGETLPLAVRVANLGNARGATQVRVALSANPGVTDADPVIFTSASPLSLDPPEEGTVVGWAAIEPTLPSGRYFVGAVADPDDAVDEIIEDNNTLVVGPIDVSGSGLAIVTPTPPNAITGVAYTRRFDAVGGAGDYQWSLDWAARSPAGLSFDTASAELSGVVAEDAAGAYEFTVTVRSGALVATRLYRLIVSPPTVPLTVLSSQLPPALAGESYSVQLVAVGGQPPYSWVISGRPPIGVSLSQGGVLGGEPQIVGASTVDVRVTDSVGTEADGVLSFRILDPTARLTILTADLPDGLAGAPYGAEVRAEGGAAPYQWRIEGRLPPGVTSEAGESVILTGTPTVAGTYPLVVEVRDSGGLLDRNAYVVEVIEEGALVILTGQPDQPALPEARLNEPYLEPDGSPVRLRAAPAGDLTWSIVSGRLPDGVQLSPGGVISGTPTEAGAFAFLVLVTNPGNDLRRATLALVVNEPIAAPPPEECSCRASSAPRGPPGPIAGLALLGLGWRWGRRRGRR